jgi:hypothetical protein
MAGPGIVEGEGALAVRAGARHGAATLAWFAGTMLLGALLVFSIQPMFARMALPLLGGAPVVWNTAMVFFQSALLAGYAYAHCLSRSFGPRGQIAGHLGLLAVACLSLPVAIGADWHPPIGGASIPWLIGLMAWTVGLPFLAVAATAPLVQRWFAGSGHPAASDPYFLYGASNLGSVLALLSYPLLVEPRLTLHEQARLWTAGYAALALAITGCALVVWRSGPAGPGAPATSRVEPGEAIGWPRRLRWLCLALVPSGLLLAVTTHITTDLAAVPLLWVVPLALYLLTYVIAFARRPWLRHAWALKAQPFILIPLVLLVTWTLPFWVGLPLHLLCLFVSALVCHDELARLRPRAEHLTEFYFWLALGGALGGAFTALLAPLLFDGVFEYPIALAAACLLRPRRAPEARPGTMDFLAATPDRRADRRTRQRPRSRPAGVRHDRHAAGLRAERGGSVRAGRAPARLWLGHRGGAGGGAADRRRAHGGRPRAQLLWRLHGEARSRRLPRAGPRHDGARRAERRSLGMARAADLLPSRRSARASVQRTGRTAARNRRGGPRRRRGRLLPRAGATLDLL